MPWAPVVTNEPYTCIMSLVSLCSCGPIEGNCGNSIAQSVYRHRRQRDRGCRGRISGNIWSAEDEMSYIPQSLSELLSIACRTDAYGATSVCGTSKTQRRHPVVLACAYTSGYKCAMSVSHIFPVRRPRPPTFDNRWRRCVPSVLAYRCVDCSLSSGLVNKVLGFHPGFTSRCLTSDGPPWFRTGRCQLDVEGILSTEARQTEDWLTTLTANAAWYFCSTLKSRLFHKHFPS